MLDKGFGVEFGQAGKSLARAKFSRVDEIRRVTSALGDKGSELESAGFDEKVYKGIFTDHQWEPPMSREKIPLRIW